MSQEKLELLKKIESHAESVQQYDPRQAPCRRETGHDWQVIEGSLMRASDNDVKAMVIFCSGCGTALRIESR